jgi:hypothetical protein
MTREEEEKDNSFPFILHLTLLSLEYNNSKIP